MRLDCYCSQSHYADHLLPIWGALDPSERGTWYVTERVLKALPDCVDGRIGRPPSPRHDPTPCLVASGPDGISVGRRPVVMVEHGAGQSYPGVTHSSYSGGIGRETTVLFLCPNEVVAVRNRERYPDAAVAVVGSPRVDALRAAVAEVGRPSSPASALPTVALTHHWDLGLVPETRSTVPYFEPGYDALAERYEVVGHGHPRHQRQFARLWRDHGIEYESDFAKICQRADLLLGDNTSALYEFAALGKPVVVLNAPWYRDELDAWPRFWEHANVGVQVESPVLLGEAVELALRRSAWVEAARQRAVRAVWGQPGGAAERAVDAIRETLAGLP